MSTRLLETITGYDKADKAMSLAVNSWNECNGAGRMVRDTFSRADDSEGGGEFYELVWLNPDTAQSMAEEIYELRTCW